MRARRGYTMVELLVAMALTGIVVGMAAQWVVHEARSRARTDRGIDADEAVALFRNGLFQDIHRGRVLRLDRERLLVAHPGPDGTADTIEWRIEAGSLSRTFGGNTTRPLSLLRDAEISWEPAPLPSSAEIFGSPWWALDRDQDGAIGPDEIDSVGSILVHVLGEVPVPPGMPAGRESLTVAIPTAGL